MRKIILFVSAVILTVQSFSQEKQVNINVKFAQPKVITVAELGIDFALGEFSETNSIGLSGSIGIYAKVTDDMRIGLVFDENYFFGKKIPDFDEKFDGVNIARLATKLIVKNTNGTLIGTFDIGVANISSGGNNEMGVTFGATVGVPLFGGTPILGGLFRHKKFTSAKTELLVFLTPKIIKEE